MYVLDHAWLLIKKETWTIVALCCILVITIILQSFVLSPLFMRTHQSFQKGNIRNNVFLLLGALLFISICLMIEYYLLSGMRGRFYMNLRSHIFEKLLYHFQEHYETFNQDELVSQTLFQTNAVAKFIIYMLTYATPVIIGFVVVFIYFFIVDKKILFPCSVMLFILFGFLFYWLIQRKIAISQERSRAYQSMSHDYQDAFDNLVNIYANNETEREVQRQQELLEEYKRAYNLELANNFHMNIAVGAFALLFMCLVIGISFYHYRRQSLTLLTISTIFFMLIFMNNNLLRLSNSYALITSNIGEITEDPNFLDYLHVPIPSSISPSTSNVNFSPPGSISFQNLFFQYPSSDKLLLDNVSVDIPLGKKTCILGRTGIGKSSLMLLLLRFNFHYQGTISINSVPIQDIPVSTLRSHIVYIPQNCYLRKSTVEENLLYGNRQLSRHDIQEKISFYGLESIFHNLPQGLDTVVMKGGQNLSMGTQKLIFLLRGLLRETGDIFVFDEPLTSLDPQTRQYVCSMIARIPSNKTVIIITHDHEILPFMNHIISIEKPNDTSPLALQTFNLNDGIFI